MKFAFIQDLEKGERCKPRAERIPTSLICEVLEVSRAGYYARKTRPKSNRACEGRVMIVKGRR